nr:DUF6286 domain-containing protein [Arthrobacter roseus]
MHSSRALPAVIAATLIGLTCLYVLLETTLKAMGQDPWLVSPEATGQWLADLPGVMGSLMLGAASTLMFFAGIVFLMLAVVPGRRARHSIPNNRAAVVVDAEVIASSLARSARTAAGVTPEQTRVTVGRNLVEVQLRPTSGTPVDRGAIRSMVEEELRRTSMTPIPEVRIHVSSSGVIGQ